MVKINLLTSMHLGSSGRTEFEVDVSFYNGTNIEFRKKVELRNVPDQQTIKVGDYPSITFTREGCHVRVAWDGCDQDTQYESHIMSLESILKMEDGWKFRGPIETMFDSVTTKWVGKTVARAVSLGRNAGLYRIYKPVENALEIAFSIPAYGCEPDYSIAYIGWDNIVSILDLDRKIDEAVAWMHQNGMPESITIAPSYGFGKLQIDRIVPIKDAVDQVPPDIWGAANSKEKLEIGEGGYFIHGSDTIRDHTKEIWLFVKRIRFDVVPVERHFFTPPIQPMKVVVGTDSQVYQLDARAYAKKVEDDNARAAYHTRHLTGPVDQNGDSGTLISEKKDKPETKESTAE